MWTSQRKSNKKAVGIKDVKGGKKRIYKLASVFYLFIGFISPKTSWQNSHILYNGHKLINSEQVAPLKMGNKKNRKQEHMIYVTVGVIGSHLSENGKIDVMHASLWFEIGSFQT